MATWAVAPYHMPNASHLMHWKSVTRTHTYPQSKECIAIEF